MRFVGVVILMLGLSMIYFFGWKGLTPTGMICDLETFFGFKLSGVDCSKNTKLSVDIPTTTTPDSGLPVGEHVA